MDEVPAQRTDHTKEPVRAVMLRKAGFLLESCVVCDS